MIDWTLVSRFGWTLEQARSLSMVDYWQLVNIDDARQKAKNSGFSKPKGK